MTGMRCGVPVDEKRRVDGVRGVCSNSSSGPNRDGIGEGSEDRSERAREARCINYQY